MKRVIAMAFLTPLALTLVFNLGCGGSKDNAGGGSGTGPAVKSTKDEGGGKTAGGAGGAIDVKETGTVKGKVTFDGTPPVAPELKIDVSNKDKNHCLSAKTDDEKTDPTWRVGPDGAVANVVVWVRAPGKGGHFRLPENLRKPDRDTVKFDQPFCAFVPHVDIMFPNYFVDGKAQPTGQKLKFLNSAPIAHNTKYEPNDQLVNTGDNKLLQPGGAIDVPSVVSADKPGKEGKFKVNCNVHQWMNAYVLLFDHPFAKVTGKDGTFEFKAPAGTEVELVYWHESMAKPEVLKKIKVDAGKEVTEDFKISK